MDLIHFEGVSKYYEQVPVIQDIDLRIATGETVVLLGPSGCGKTTLLKLANGLIVPEKGVVRFKGQPVRPKDSIRIRRKIGYVIQDVGLFPHLTIRENILMPLKIKGEQTKHVSVEAWLERVGLDSHLTDRLPGELSGGQQQRIGIARALISDPELILLDEPFSALDNITRGQLQDDFLKLESLIKKTNILVTHDVQEAFKLGDRIALLDEGVIQQVGKPLELLMQPANAFVAQFLSQDRQLLELEHIHIGEQRITLLEALRDQKLGAAKKKDLFDQYLKMKRES